MQAPLFVAASDVLTRMQINSDLSGVNDVINSALSGAHLHVQSVLQSKLVQATQDCRFNLDPDSFSGLQPNGQFKLGLPAYFIRDDQPVVVTYADKWTMTNALSVDPTLMFVDRPAGLVYIDADAYCGKYVRVQCTTGFNPGDQTADPVVAPEDIPDWLYEAILAYVGVVLDVSQTTNRAKDAKDVYQRAGDHAMSVMLPFLRSKGFMLKPFNAA